LTAVLRERSASASRSASHIFHRFNAWLSATFPFLWRTRALVWISVGLLAAAGSRAYAQYEHVEIGTLAGLEARLFFLSVWTYVLYGAFVAAIADTVRRTSAVFSVRDGWRVFVCVSLVMAALALPQYVYARIVFARIASLETPSRLQAMLDFHGRHRFWQCWDRPDDELVKANADVITADLLRYGLVTQLSFAHSREADCPYSIFARLDEPSAAWSSFTIKLFKERLMEIDAAHRYVRGDDGPFSGLLIPNDLSGTVTVATLSSVLVVGWLSTPLFRSRVLSTSRRLRRRWTWRPLIAARLDARLAASWPTVWLSRLHVAFPYLLLPPVVVVVAFLVTRQARAPFTVATLLPSVVASLVLGMRSQSVTRSLPKSAVREIGTFSMHTAVYVLAAVIPVSISTNDQATIAITLLSCIILAAMWQGARNGSVVTAYGGHCLAVAMVAGAIFAVGWIADNLAGATAFIFLIMISEAVLIWLARRVAATPRRLLVSTVLAMAPAPGFAVMILLAPRPADVAIGTGAVASAISFAGVAICLLALHRDRRVVA
jgi:hypothetical protein